MGVSLIGFIGNEIGAEGGDKAADGDAEGWTWGFRKILVTRENNDLSEELADGGTDDDFLTWDPISGRAGSAVWDLVERVFCHFGSPSVIATDMGVDGVQFNPLQMNCK
jgi:hypothetical protein